MVAGSNPVTPTSGAKEADSKVIFEVGFFFTLGREIIGCNFISQSYQGYYIKTRRPPRVRCSTGSVGGHIKCEGNAFI